jgi:hypothetical protein
MTTENVLTRFKVFYPDTDNTTTFQWFEEESKAREFIEALKKKNSTARLFPCEFLIQPKETVVERIFSHRIEFTILKVNPETYVVDCGIGQRISQTFSSHGEARQGIDAYLKTPFSYQGLPTVIPSI